MPEPVVEPLGGHEYLVHLLQDGDAVETVVRASPAFLADVAPPGVAESQVISATMAYLLSKQRADELPGQLDLEDVAAAYAGFADSLKSWLNRQPP